MNRQEALFKYLLRRADDGLVLAQRLCEWTGHGPFLEEDLSLTNITLDIFGRSKSLLEYAASIEGKGRSEDDLAFLRNDREYFNALICELPNGDYAKTILRQAFIDCADLLLYKALSESKDETLAGIAAKSVKEILYHKRHSFSWVIRFGNGTGESMARLNKALAELWQYTGELFEMDDTDEMLVKENIVPDLRALHPQWKKEIAALFLEANLEIPAGDYMQTGGRNGIHTEHLGFLLAEMQVLPRTYPGAKW